MSRNDFGQSACVQPALRLGKKARDHSGDRIPAGAKLLGAMVLSVLAMGCRTAAELAALGAVNLSVLLFWGYGFRTLRRGAKVFINQAVVITGLYLVRFGIKGLMPGLEISGQMFLTFLPGAILVQTTPHAQITRTLSRIMPCRPAFVMSTCMRFVPLMIDEIRTIREGQIMRGARILSSDLLKPWNWPDVIYCLVVPAILRTLKLAGEIALAARAREFGVTDRRTCWPGR